MEIFCPYRICPLGAHVDHQKGLITGFAIDKGVRLTYEPSGDNNVILKSSNFEEVVSFTLNGLLEIKDDWGNYMRGATKILRTHYDIRCGIIGKFVGELPVGGLSSSAAVTLAYIKAIASVNHIELTDMDLIEYAYLSETEFLGLKIGKLDQSCEVLCKKNHYFYMDTLDMTYQLIPEAKIHDDYKFLIIYSGQARKLVNSDYNVRVDECKSSAYLTKALQNIKYGKYIDTYLRDIDYSTFKLTMDSLPEKWKMRAIHFYEENIRVKKGIECWKNGDMIGFGKHVKDSGESSIRLYEAGSRLLVDLHNIINSVSGVYGGRFMGGGFNGCCLAIIDPKLETSIITNIKNKFLLKHPEMSGSFGIFPCNSADGIKYN